MRKFIAALAIGGLTLVGCGSGEPTPRETVYVEQDTPETSANPEQDYLNAVASEMTSSAMNNSRQGDILDLGYAVCADIDAGNSPVEIENDLLEVQRDLGFTKNEVAAIWAASVVFLCPEHYNTLQGGST